jgi:cytidylate kinase
MKRAKGVLVMKKMIITIGRQYGSGGHAIAEKVAEELGIHFYDEAKISASAQKKGLNVAKKDETKDVTDFGNYLIKKYDPMIQKTEQDEIFDLEEQTILTAAAEGSAVFVGHCANYVLRDEPDLLSIFIYAPAEFRIRRVMEVYGAADRGRAIRIIKKTDRTRRNYNRYYSEYEWGGTEGNHFLMDSSIFGIEETARLIAEIARKHFKE